MGEERNIVDQLLGQFENISIQQHDQRQQNGKSEEKKMANHQLEKISIHEGKKMVDQRLEKISIQQHDERRQRPNGNDVKEQEVGELAELLEASLRLNDAKKTKKERKTGVELRPYQKVLVKRIKKYLKRKGTTTEQPEHKHALVYLPTGGGKTIIASHLMRYLAIKKKKRCLFVVNRCVLIDQTAQKLELCGVKEYGFMKSKYTENQEALIQIASIQTLLSWFKKGKEMTQYFDLILVDEAHCIIAKTYQLLMDRFPMSKVLGLTATPFRSKEGESLCQVFQHFIEGPTVSELIREGHLVNAVVYPPSRINVCSLTTKVAVLDSTLKSAAKRWKRLCQGKRTIAFCASIDQSKRFVNVLAEEGVVAVHIDGKTKDTDRDLIYERLDKNEIDLISSVGVLCEGFDLPSLEALICLRPTNSKGLHIQQIGRGLRPYKNKRTLIVLDEVGNTYRNGLVHLPLGFDWENDNIVKQQKSFISFCKCQAIIINRQKRCLLCKQQAPKQPFADCTNI